MITDKRIKEAEINVSRYINEELLLKKVVDANIINILKKNALESLELGKSILENKQSDLWAVVINYYSMFYITNAVLCSKGYKIGDKLAHKITSDALIFLIRKNLKNSLIESYENMMDQALINTKSDTLIEFFDFERKKRNFFQYEMSEDIKHSKAQTSYERAKEFYFEMFKLLE